MFKFLGKHKVQKQDKFQSILGSRSGRRRASIIYKILKFWENEGLDKYTKRKPWLKMDHKQLTGFYGALRNPNYSGPSLF